MTITVRLFAIARDAAGTDSLTLCLPAGATTADVASMLAERHHPLARVLPSCVFAVNQQYAPPTTALRDGDEVAVIPPVSGG